ncbi:methylamine utilization protein [Chitinivorax sp. B]|uniref:methylamine utilization protein n=1 Tax=Chitinivorax sp. B TaxID=2502235 RepID=UPI00148594F5|nr:methylamine utilization protein [Chitinivorax sp. B]
MQDPFDLLLGKAWHWLTTSILTVFCSCWMQTSQASTLSITVNDQSGKPLEHAVVTLSQPNQSPALKPGKATIDQIDKEFVPFVSVISTGTSVSFPNKDNTRHHVYSFSGTKKFELKLYSGTPSQPVIFDKPGIVVLGCNIHDWMLAYVYVTDDPYFTSTGNNGLAKFDTLPSGDWQVRIWHPRQTGAEFTAIVKQTDTHQVITLKIDTTTTKQPAKRPPGGGKYQYDRP